MKRILASLFVLVLAFSLIPASAQSAPEWTGTQVVAVANGRSAVGSSGHWSLVSSAMYFDIPKQDTNFWFVYFGAEYADTSLGLWVTPVVGYAGKWFVDQDGLDLGIWAGHGLGRWNYDIDCEVILDTKGTSDYYGLYTIGYSWDNGIRLAAWSEQINGEFQAGPRVELPMGAINAKIGYLIGNDEHALRLTFGN